MCVNLLVSRVTLIRERWFWIAHKSDEGERNLPLTCIKTYIWDKYSEPLTEKQAMLAIYILQQRCLSKSDKVIHGMHGMFTTVRFAMLGCL